MKRPYFRKYVATVLEETSSEDLRQLIFTRTVNWCAILGFLALFIGIILEILSRRWSLVIVYAIAYAGLLAVKFGKRLPFNLRATILITIIATIGTVTLLSSGLYGSGRIYLLAIPVIASLLLGSGRSYISWIMVVLILLGVGLLMLNGTLPIPDLEPRSSNASILAWFVAVLSFALVSIIGTASLAVMERGLENIFRYQKQIHRTIELEHRQLELRVAQRTQRLERHLAQAHAVAEINRQINSILDVDGLLAEFVQLMSDKLGVYYVGVFLVDAQGEKANLRAGSGIAGKRMLEDHFQFPIDDSSTIGWVCKNGKARIVHDVGKAAARFDNPNLPLARSELALPIVAPQDLWGVMSLQSVYSEDFDQDDVTLFQGVADNLAIVLQNANLYQKTRRSLEDISDLNKRYLMESWKQVLEEGEVSSYATQKDLPQEPLPTSTMQFPLTLRELTIGQLTLETERLGFTPQELAFIESIITQASYALENVRLLKKTQRQASYERLLSDLSRTVSSSTDLETILRTTVQELGQVLDASESVIRLDPPTSETPATAGEQSYAFS